VDQAESFSLHSLKSSFYDAHSNECTIINQLNCYGYESNDFGSNSIILVDLAD
jgi:hypothetical protein